MAGHKQQEGHSKECREINGQFLLEADRSAPDTLEISRRLDGLIFGKFLHNYAADAHAQMIVSAETKSITLTLPKSQPLPSTGYLMLEEKAECIDGWIEIQSRSRDGSEGTVAVTGRISKLKTLDDGALLVQVRRIRTNHSLLISYWGDDTETWHIFRRVK